MVSLSIEVIFFIRLTSADYKCGGERPCTDVSGFCMYPVFQSHFLNSTQVIHLHVVRVSMSSISRRGKKRAGEIRIITAQFNTFRLDRLESRTSS
jgi:hypothetical protein